MSLALVTARTICLSSLSPTTTHHVTHILAHFYNCNRTRHPPSHHPPHRVSSGAQSSSKCRHSRPVIPTTCKKSLHGEKEFSPVPQRKQVVRWQHMAQRRGPDHVHRCTRMHNAICGGGKRIRGYLKIHAHDNGGDRGQRGRGDHGGVVCTQSP